MHAVFVWALGLPLIIATVAYQDFYLKTTAVQPLLTLEVCGTVCVRVCVCVHACMRVCVQPHLPGR